MILQRTKMLYLAIFLPPSYPSFRSVFPTFLLSVYARATCTQFRTSIFNLSISLNELLELGRQLSNLFKSTFCFCQRSFSFLDFGAECLLGFLCTAEGQGLFRFILLCRLVLFLFLLLCLESSLKNVFRICHSFGASRSLGFKAVEPLSQLDDRFLQQVLCIGDGLLCKGAALSRFRLEGNGQCTRQGAIEARRLQHLQDEVDVLGPFAPLLPIQATGLQHCPFLFKNSFVLSALCHHCSTFCLKTLFLAFRSSHLFLGGRDLLLGRLQSFSFLLFHGLRGSSLFPCSGYCLSGFFQLRLIRLQTRFSFFKLFRVVLVHHIHNSFQHFFRF
mmetsp:Transcript_3052/g.7001  ORF Transcript_3052/g.7001 Transcript_3052/m.7001 type:complete len:331 (-) Transcript_3052:223-1215(-)